MLGTTLRLLMLVLSLLAIPAHARLPDGWTPPPAPPGMLWYCWLGEEDQPQGLPCLALYTQSEIDALNLPQEDAQYLASITQMAELGTLTPSILLTSLTARPDLWVGRSVWNIPVYGSLPSGTAWVSELASSAMCRDKSSDCRIVFDSTITLITAWFDQAE